jgi:hypothetical protein
VVGGEEVKGVAGIRKEGEAGEDKRMLRMMRSDSRFRVDRN